MSVINFIKSKLFLKHIILIIIVSLVSIWLIFRALNAFTNHGETYQVGNYIGMKLNEIESNSLNDVFDFVVIDSIYDNELEKQTVVSQLPLPNSSVKKNRNIYLTIVASQPEMVASPNLQDLTIRQAAAVLETFGLAIGRVEFVPDFGNTVISWKQKGKNLQPGDKLIKRSKIDLLVGSGEGISNAIIPDLIGKSKVEARNIILSSGLNIGSEYFLNRLDTINVKVVRQNPQDTVKTAVPLGSKIDIWYE